MAVIIMHLKDKIRMDILGGVLLPWSEMKVVKIGGEMQSVPSTVQIWRLMILQFSSVRGA